MPQHDAGRELTVVAARADAIDDIDRLTQAAPPHRGTAVVILGEATCARATLEVDADGHAVLRPLGLAVIANEPGQAVLYLELRGRVSTWPPQRLARLRCERESVSVVFRPASSSIQPRGERL